ncbi:peptidoglycan D,D-transpeptidase FtsI family protein [Maritalea porphyrae]|jgi:cell division protein FtsI (penicillin-binding protein 3)|uniref:peptidoglycan D,D-transpeptidase FtsI family protein n=2 Tax=Maritalea TaxID=623276 RepID=UPI0022AE8E19|nr:penicillin-binding protein 2 [Maritalea porphyrae]MCZ4272570.1 penicillin-binding protein 2 [Maritalea porphyrae]
MSDVMHDVGPAIAIDGARKSRGHMTKSRIRLTVALAMLVFSIVAVRLVMLAAVEVDDVALGQARPALTATRPALVDRNGSPLALDIQVPSLFAEPRRIIDVDEAVEALSIEFPDMDRKWLRGRLDGDEGFVWLRRELTPQQKERILRLGIPGIDFVSESRRFYPGGNVAAHILGAVNVDNVGIAGLERFLDQREVALLQDLGFARDRSLQPVELSIDLRVQHVMHNELVDALTRYQAIAAAGAMMNVRTGEIVALVSLPDFDPNMPAGALEEGRINRITAGKFELGSTLKPITAAAALDSGLVQITDKFDATKPVQFGRFRIGDFHAKKRVLSLPEVIKYSSNIGTIKMMQALGKERFRAFLANVGMDGSPVIELPEKTQSQIKDKFSEVGAATASFGHGLSITPLQLLTAYAALVNGGDFIAPTLLPRDRIAALANSKRVINERTSDQIRYLLRLNAIEGSGRKAAPDGYRVGGKTGTAEKVVDGKYSDDKLLNVFASAFPMDAPQYAMVILVDEPKKEDERSGHTAAWNAGAVTGRIIERVAPMLRIVPNLDPELDAQLVPVELR